MYGDQSPVFDFTAKLRLELFTVKLRKWTGPTFASEQRRPGVIDVLPQRGDQTNSSDYDAAHTANLPNLGERNKSKMKILGKRWRLRGFQLR